MAEANSTPSSPRLFYVVAQASLCLWLAASILLLGGMPSEWARWGDLLGVLFCVSGFFAGTLKWAGPVALAGLAWLGWSLFSAWHLSPTPWVGERDVVLWIQAWLVFTWRWHDRPGRGPGQWPAWTLAGAVALASAMACWQHWVQPGWLMLGAYQVSQYIGRSAGSFGNPNHFAALLVLVTPAVVALGMDRSRPTVMRAPWYYVAAFFSLALAFTFSRGGWLAAIAVGLLAWSRGRRSRAWLGFFGVALVVFALGMPDMRDRIFALRTSGGETARAVLWRSATHLAKENALVGTGAGSFEAVFERVRPAGFRDEPGYVHQEYLQLWLEYGLVGVALLGLGAALTLRGSGVPPQRGEGWDNPRVTRAVGLGVAGVAVASFFDFHLHVPGVLLPMAWFAGDWMRRRENVAEPHALPPWSFRAGWVVVGLFGGWLGFANHHAEALRLRAAHALEGVLDGDFTQAASQAALLEGAATRLDQAIRWRPSNAMLWSDRAQLEIIRAELFPALSEQAVKDAEAFARRAVQTGGGTHLPWIRLGVSLQHQGRRAEASEAFHRALERAPAKAIGWYYYARFLALRPSTQGLAHAAVEHALSLDPEYTAAQALRTRLSSAQ